MIGNLRLVDVILLTFLFTMSDCASWSCFQDGKEQLIWPSWVAGIWYEVARFPQSDVPACVKVIAPESQIEGNYTLELDYVNNVNKGWQPTKEALVFPWAEAIKGRFNFQYTDGDTIVNMNFKFLGSMRGFSIVCGYTDFATGLSIIRLLSRNKLINSTVKAEIAALANQFNVTMPDLTWVQQDGRCNSSSKLSIFNVGLLIIFYLCHRHFY